jgi:alpha/beta superfamily hydrolase
MLGCRAESIDYRGLDDPAARVAKLVAECRGVTEPLVLVGSSMGGYVATAAAAEVGASGLFVLAPAYYMKEYAALAPPRGLPIVIVHGWRDEVVPVEHSLRFAKETRATLHVVDSDHQLSDKIDDINDYLERFIRGLATAGEEAP